MVEIYGENIKDLLCNNNENLKIWWSQKRGIYIDKCTTVPVVSEEEMFELFQMGNEAKRVWETKLNTNSSRAHTLFMLELI